jgi:glutathione S-transferase
MMILVGQYDSPFVRRVGIALKLYDLPFEHRPWSIFGDADKLASLNPLMRVPALVLDDGEVLVDSPSMIDFLDSLVPPGQALFPRHEPARRRAVRIAALATGVSDKVASLFYELRLREPAHVSQFWAKRCRAQIAAGLDGLEAARAACAERDWFGERMGHADIAVVCMLRHLAEAHPDLAAGAGWPALAAFAARLEALPVFREISQPFVPPAA